MSLGTLLAELRAKRARLADALRELDGDIASVERTMQVAEKHGMSAEALATGLPKETAQASPAATAPQAGAQASQREEDGPAITERTRRAVASLAERYDMDKPSKVDGKRRPVEHEAIPRSGEALRDLRDKADRLAKATDDEKPGAGGRRRYSSRGLVTGEPIAPQLIAILRAAGGPLTSAECAATMLKKRGLDYEGDRFSAVVSRVSSRFADLAKRGRVKRLPTDDGRVFAWELVAEQKGGRGKAKDEPVPVKEDPIRKDGKPDLVRLFRIPPKPKTTARGRRR